MTATLARRVEVLEAALPPQPSGLAAARWPGDEPPDWWALAPVPVRRYALALLEEAAVLAGQVGEMGAAWAAVAARHPGAADLFRLLHDHAERGESVPLTVAQRTVLWAGWLRIWDASTASSSDTTAQRYWGVDHGGLWALWMDKAGALVVRTWRRGPGRQPAVLAVAGLGPVELALLAADE